MKLAQKFNLSLLSKTNILRWIYTASNVAHVPDATSTNDILHVINELNTSYRFAKFTLNKQNAIDISTSLAFLRTKL